MAWRVRVGEECNGESRRGEDAEREWRLAPEPARESASAGEEGKPRGGGDELARLFDLASDLLATISPAGRLGLLNPAWEKVLGWSRDELRSMPLRELLHPDDRQRAIERFAEPADGAGRVENLAARLRHRDGSWRWLVWSAHFDEGTWYVTANDLTDKLSLEQQALHDPLTRLPNRLLLLDRARQALARLHRDRRAIALLFVDLDRFKAVNDTLGHRAGDELLIQVASRLREVLREEDTIARFGGDEFVILAEELEGDAEAVGVAERVLHALEEPFELEQARVSLRASIGLSVTSDPSRPAEDLLREADIAMYRAKAGGGHDLELFDERLRRQVAARLDIDSRLRHALGREELHLAYQPQLRLDGRGRVGWEALLRWQPRGSLQVEPGEFLPLAEESRLIVSIGEWVLRAATVQAALWRRRNRFAPTMAVNVSARELGEGGLVGRVEEALAASGLPPAALCLELEERAVVADPRASAEVLRQLRELGVHIALDHFGEGRTSLNLVTSMPVDTIKIDRAVVQSLQSDSHARAVVSALVSLARELKLRLIATGIETERQLKLCHKLGCPVGQGYLLAPPQPPL